MRVLASAMVKNISNKLHPSVNKNPPLWDTKAGLVSGCSRPAQFWKQTRLTFDTSHQLPEEDPPFFWGATKGVNRLGTVFGATSRATLPKKLEATSRVTRGGFNWNLREQETSCQVEHLQHPYDIP